MGDRKGLLLGAVVVEPQAERFRDAQAGRDLHGDNCCIAPGEERACRSVSEAGQRILRGGPVLRDGGENDADFGVVGHVDGCPAHAGDLPAVQPLAGKVALLEGKFERSFDDDRLIADRALRKCAVLQGKQVVFGVLCQHLPDALHAVVGAPLFPGKKAAPVGAKGRGPDALDAACPQEVLVQPGKRDAYCCNAFRCDGFRCNTFRRAGGGRLDRGRLDRGT